MMDNHFKNSFLINCVAFHQSLFCFFPLFWKVNLSLALPLVGGCAFYLLNKCGPYVFPQEGMPFSVQGSSLSSCSSFPLLAFLCWWFFLCPFSLSYFLLERWLNLLYQNFLSIYFLLKLLSSFILSNSFKWCGLHLTTAHF